MVFTELVKNNNKGEKLRFSLWLEEAWRKILTHQRPYLILTK